MLLVNCFLLVRRDIEQTFKKGIALFEGFYGNSNMFNGIHRSAAVIYIFRKIVIFLFCKVRIRDIPTNKTIEIMHKLFTKVFILFTVLSCTTAVTAQDYLVDQVFLGTKSKIDLLILFGIQVDYDVNMYRILYETIGSDQLPDTASGLLVIPVVPEGTPLPIVLYEHGTTNGPNDVPSQQKGGYEVALGYAAFGFITVAPDYLGLGNSNGFHPYVHAATESSASLDMLNGSLEFLEFNSGANWDPNFLFVSGYSQGGHAGMAVHREIEDFWSFVYPVSAAAHMSGPYSISGVMRDKILSDDSYGFPAYIAYLVLGYQPIYGNLYNDLNDVFKQPFATEINSFFEGDITLDTLNNRLVQQLIAIDGDTINKKMFQDSVITGIVNNPNHPINLALNDNDTYNWAPSAPTRLYYCGGDQQIPYQNSIVAETTMNDLGANDVQAIDLNPNFDHGDCVLPAVLSSIVFFNSIINPSSIKDLDHAAPELSVSPNPVSDVLTIDWEKANNGMTYEIINANGQTVMKNFSHGKEIRVEHLSSGLYFVLCTVGHETRFARFIHQ